ncbi:MAG: peptidylprolyl isomerase [Paludibacteraceae bacterium]|nr:peptidylprolyl isomerase [Paludibacteraceae bacterium]
MRKFICLVALWIFVCSTFATDELLMTIGNKKILQSEFEYFYKKNNKETLLNSEIDEYLQQFQNFKLKVCEAEALKLDTASSFVEEFSSYRSQIVAPYLTDKNKEDDLMQEVYSHLLEDVDASHILVRVPYNAPPEDTLKLYQKALDICKRLEKENFEDVAKETSDDYSAKQNGGRLGYFTGMMTIFPFENAAYRMKIGEISKPVRSAIGYHIIKINNKRKAVGEVRVAHILKMVSQHMTKKQQDSIQDLTQEIFKRLGNNEDFASLAKEFSDDRQTSSNGGELMWFGLGKMAKEFEKTAFELRNIGEVSKPIKTVYGWHIIQLKEKREVSSFDKKKNEIARLIQYDGRKEAIRQSFIKQLKIDYKFSADSCVLKKIFNAFNASNDKSTFIENIENKNDVALATFANQTIWMNEFVDFLIKEFSNAKSTDINVVFDYFSGEKIIAFEDSQLENKHPDFKNLMQEYHDGLLFFEVSKLKIWDEAAKDTTKLKLYFEENKDTFKTDGPYFKGFIIECKNKKIAKQVKKIITNAHPDSIDSYIKTRINIDSTLNVKVQKGFWEKGDNPVADKKIFKSKNSYKAESKLPIIETVGRKLQIPENYNDVLGKVISLYQNYLENEWVSALRKKYPIWVNEKELNKYRK